jgi:hypothetical protein
MAVRAAVPAEQRLHAIAALDALGTRGHGQDRLGAAAPGRGDAGLPSRALQGPGLAPGPALARRPPPEGPTFGHAGPKDTVTRIAPAVIIMANNPA